MDVELTSREIELKETCGKDRIEVTAVVPNQFRGAVDWKISTPRAVHLDLVTLAGSIRVGDTDGNVTIRTTGGSVTVGQIRGQAAIITQGGSIRSGNIGASAELRSNGGSLDVGDVQGNAEFQTAGGPINAGIVSGRVRAETAGGSITIREVHGEIVANTEAGDITVGNAGRVTAKTGGGNIIGRNVTGPFKGHTESGDIRVERTTSWVEAVTGFGTVFVRLVPTNLDADLHLDLQTGVGDVIVFLPEKLRATIDATVEKAAARQNNQITSDFPNQSPVANGLVANRFFAGARSQTMLNGGGNRMRFYTSLGKIEIRKN